MTDAFRPQPAAPGSHAPRIRLVVAYARNRVIGREGGLPWHLPGDLAHFRKQTWGYPVIMGRHTWESLPHALPGRRNLVLSRSAHVQGADAEVHASLETALAACRDDARVSVIGGEAVFRRALPLADEIIATEIGADIPGDTWFPPLPEGQWRMCERVAQPAENGLPYDFVRYVRAGDQPA